MVGDVRRKLNTREELCYRSVGIGLHPSSPCCCLSLGLSVVDLSARIDYLIYNSSWSLEYCLKARPLNPPMKHKMLMEIILWNIRIKRSSIWLHVWEYYEKHFAASFAWSERLGRPSAPHGSDLGSYNRRHAGSWGGRVGPYLSSTKSTHNKTSPPTLTNFVPSHLCVLPWNCRLI